MRGLTHMICVKILKYPGKRYYSYTLGYNRVIALTSKVTKGQIHIFQQILN